MRINFRTQLQTFWDLEVGTQALPILKQQSCVSFRWAWSCLCFLILLSNEEGGFEINFHDNNHSRMAPDFLLSGDSHTGEETVVWDSSSGSTSIYCSQLSHTYDFLCLMAKIRLSLLIPVFHQAGLPLEPPSATCDWCYFLLDALWVSWLLQIFLVRMTQN